MPCTKTTCPSSNYWAKEVLNVDPDNLDAHYTLALEALDYRTPNVPEARRHLEVLEKKKAPAIRRALGPREARRGDRRSDGSSERVGPGSSDQAWARLGSGRPHGRAPDRIDGDPGRGRSGSIGRSR